MNARHQWLAIHAGGRREVLRRLLPELLTRNIKIQDFYFHWDNDQPSLILLFALEGNCKQTLHRTINTIEDALDTLMTLYPWEEQPLLDWGGKLTPRRLSVTLDATLDSSKFPYPGTPEVTQQIYRLLEHDGTEIKSVWVHVMHLALNLYPVLRTNQQTLLKRIPAAIRQQIPAKLAYLKKNTSLPHEQPPLWGVIRDAMATVGMADRGRLLKSSADRLGFRPDEQAWLMLVAGAIKQEAVGGFR